MLGMKMKLALADVVLWDTHPLALSATPIQVYIDGIPQLSDASVEECLSAKPASFQDAPKVPNFDREVQETLKWEGLPPLLPKEWELKEFLENLKSRDFELDDHEPLAGGGRRTKDGVLFVGVGKVYMKEIVDGELQVKLVYISDAALAKEQGDATEEDISSLPHGLAIFRKGRLACYGPMFACSSHLASSRFVYVDLKGGAISPGLISFGAPLGLKEIDQEPSTGDGEVTDPLVKEVSGLVKGAVVRASDGLQFATRDAL